MKYGVGITISKRHYCKRFLIIFACISLASYVIIDLNIKSKLVELRDRFDLASKPLQIANTSKAYFVDTEGCKMPSFNIMDENVSKFMQQLRPVICDKPLTVLRDNKIILNMDPNEIVEIFNISDTSKIICYLQSFRRKTDSHSIYEKEKITFNLSDNVSVTAEFVKITCKNSENNNTFYKDFHFTTPISQTMKGSSVQNNSRLSVMVIGIDSVSHLNFLRQMNTTASLIKGSSTAVGLFGYNKVGDNTYPNLVPVLSGLDENEMNQACLQQKKYRSYDKCPLIWKRFRDLQYKTVFMEDVGSLGLFNYLRGGFKTQPTDFYPRPLVLEMEKYVGLMKRGNCYSCLGGRRPVDVVFEYIKQLIPQLQKEHFFSFFWTVAMTHDYFNMPALIDEDIAQLIKLLNVTKVLNHTALVLMSDHGLRWGSFRKTYQGMVEERQPFLYLLLPYWFATQYPSALANLKQNAHRLSTPFDVHATFQDLSDLHTIYPKIIRKRSMELLESDVLPRGISLFLPIAQSRTCESASIAPHWCTCHEKQEIPKNDPRVQRVARYIVKIINDKLQPYPQCRGIYLNSILEANVASANKNITLEAKSDVLTDITVRIQTKPGLGEFEATVRMSQSSIDITGTISRTNLYGKQSYCIDNYLLKMYCYCDR